MTTNGGAVTAKGILIGEGFAATIELSRPCSCGNTTFTLTRVEEALVLSCSACSSTIATGSTGQTQDKSDRDLADSRLTLEAGSWAERHKPDF